MKKYFVFLFLVIFIQCKEKTSTETVSDKKPTQETVLQPLPQADMQEIYNHCTAVDYIFHKLPFSLSQNDQASVRTNLTFIAPEGIDGDLQGCVALGREFFKFGGDVKYEAEIYFSQGCLYHVWMVDNQPAYANKLSQAGFNFYGNLVQQVQAQRQKNGQ